MHFETEKEKIPSYMNEFHIEILGIAIVNISIMHMVIESIA